MASKSTAKRKFAPKPAPELDLKPIMNLMVVLIPMLLYSASFIKFASVNATKASGQGKPKELDPDDKPKPPLKLMVKITEDSFIIEAAALLDEEGMIASPAEDGSAQAVELFTIDIDEAKAEDRLNLLRAEYKEKKRPIPESLLESTKKVYSYDFLQLNTKIGIIKKAVKNGDAQAGLEKGESQFDKADQIVIAAQGNIPYELLIKVMDTVRCKMLTPAQKEARKEEIAEKKAKEGKTKIRNRNKYGCILDLKALGDEDANTYYYDVILNSKLIE